MMPVMWTDTHCHLDAPEFDADRDAVAARARAAGIERIVIPAVDVNNFDRVQALARRHDGAYALGIHPLFVAGSADADLDRLRERVTAARAERDPRLVAIGEIGLDHFMPGTDPARQERFLVAQLELARDHELPVILHSRRAVDPLLKHLRRIRPPGGIAHAFNGSPQQAEVFVTLGFKLGFGGAMTFDRALQIRRLAQALPLDALVLETDAPDIPPHWLYRTAAERAAGARARNEPAELARIAQTLAGLRELPLDELATAIEDNARVALPGLAGLAARSAA